MAFLYYYYTSSFSMQKRCIITLLLLLASVLRFHRGGVDIRREEWFLIYCDQNLANLKKYLWCGAFGRAHFVYFFFSYTVYRYSTRDVFEPCFRKNTMKKNFFVEVKKALTIKITFILSIINMLIYSIHIWIAKNGLIILRKQVLHKSLVFAWFNDVFY